MITESVDLSEEERIEQFEPIEAYFVAQIEVPFGKVRTYEAGSPSDEDLQIEFLRNYLDYCALSWSAIAVMQVMARTFSKPYNRRFCWH